MAPGIPGTFAPFPLAIMVAFMYWQSSAIGAGFGTNYQFRKRWIDSMDNTTFNYWRDNPKLWLKEQQRILLDIKPMMLQAMRSFEDMNLPIIDMMGNFFKTLVKEIPDITGQTITGVTESQGEKYQAMFADMGSSITSFFNSIARGVPEAQAYRDTSSQHKNLETSLQSKETIKLAGEGSLLAAADNQPDYKQIQEVEKITPRVITIRLEPKESQALIKFT